MQILLSLAPICSSALAEETFQAQAGFEMQLLAAEPLVSDPVAIAYDENARAYIAEMGDYPHTDKAADVPFTERTADLPLGRIRLLEDTNGDGRFDRSTIFADELSWPTGLAVWQGGIYVAATPDIWYLKDTDGDGKADVRRRVFTGFRKFNVQAVINNLIWGLDNKIYGAGGSNGGTIAHLDRPEEKPVALGRNDFCFDPRDERLELVSGGQRFGNAFDDWGNRFLCNIRNPVQHVLLPQRYLARNPLLAAPPTVHDAAAAGDTLPVYRISPIEPWREVRARRWASEVSPSYPRSETAAGGYFTSSSGVTIYRGDAYPREFHGNAFLGEVAANAIHRQTVKPDGVTFVAKRADDKVEFVASTDTWFRPVNFVNAPDGTLHVLDMRRETIEHPWSIPDDILKELDLRSGRDQGRIWRLAPPGFKAPSDLRLGEKTTSKLVAELEHPNAWRRETAQRLLFERQDPAAVAPLRRQLQGSAADLGRLHSLWSLQGLGALSDEDVLGALRDRSAGVREHAVRLAEPRMAQSAPLLDRMLEMATDAEIRVRFQVAFALGETSDPRAVEALAAIARRDGGDLWVRTAVLSSIHGRADDVLLTLWRGESSAESPAPLETLRELAFQIGASRDEAKAAQTLEALATRDTASERIEAARNEIVIGLAGGLKRTGKSLGEIAARASDPAREMASHITQRAKDIALREDGALEQRTQAIAMLSFGGFEEARQPLASLLAPAQPSEMQLAAVRALGSFPQAEVAGLLLERYRGLTPSARAEAIQALLARPTHIAALLAAIEAGDISAADVPTIRRAALMRHADAAVRDKATELFGKERPGPRTDALRAYQPALDMPFDRERGRMIYQRECQTCHRLDGQGYDVGPNLESIRNRTPEELMTAVLDPNREVSPNYLEYIAVLTDGRVATGIIANESAASITLRRPEGVEESILRREIDDLASSGKSIMPEGIEQRISLQDMADLLGYLLKREAKP